MSALNGRFRGYQSRALQYRGIVACVWCCISKGLAGSLGAAQPPPRQGTTGHGAITRPGSGTCMLRVPVVVLVPAALASRVLGARSRGQPQRPVDLSPYCVRTVSAGACWVQVLALLLREPILPPDCANAAAASGLARDDKQRRQGSIGVASPQARVSPEERDRRVPGRDLDLTR